MRIIRTAILALTLGLYSPFANAGVYADDLSKCLVKSASTDDQLLMVQWIFSGFSLHPAVQPLVSITPAQRASFDQGIAALFQRLLVNDCRSETIDALKYEGPSSMEVGFKTLGEVAGRSLTTDPRVSQAMQGFLAYVDKDKMGELMKAAGIPERNPPASPNK